MTAEQFHNEWNRVYPGVSIEPQLLSLRGRPGLRIHSLPASKRYAETSAEWDLLLSRHNRIFNDLFGEGSIVHLVTGEYHYPDHIEVHSISSVGIAKELDLIPLGVFDLHEIASTFDKGQVYRPMFTTITWIDHGWDPILRAFADNELNGFFVSFETETIIAPYDGGIDLAMKDAEAKEKWKARYQEWLAPQGW